MQIILDRARDMNYYIEQLNSKVPLSQIEFIGRVQPWLRYLDLSQHYVAWQSYYMDLVTIL